jgi:hypothetical protein
MPTNAAHTSGVFFLRPAFFLAIIPRNAMI